MIYLLRTGEEFDNTDAKELIPTPRRLDSMVTLCFPKVQLHRKQKYPAHRFVRASRNSEIEDCWVPDI